VTGIDSEETLDLVSSDIENMPLFSRRELQIKSDTDVKKLRVRKCNPPSENPTPCQKT
jgi:hypothetical protein